MEQREQNFGQSHGFAVLYEDSFEITVFRMKYNISLGEPKLTGSRLTVELGGQRKVQTPILFLAWLVFCIYEQHRCTHDVCLLSSIRNVVG